MSRQAAANDIEALIVTGDSDLLQLVDEHVFVVLPGGQRFGEYRIFDPSAVQARYGFGPERVVDYKALVGDKSDNIPGVPGVGDKTAKQLIDQFSTFDEMFEQAEEIEQARARNAIVENREIAYQSRELVTIVRDVPIELDLDLCAIHDFDRATAVRIFQDLEFRSLLTKLPGDENGSEDAGEMGRREASRKRVASDETLKALALGLPMRQWLRLTLKRMASIHNAANWSGLLSPLPRMLVIMCRFDIRRANSRIRARDREILGPVFEAHRT